MQAVSLSDKYAAWREGAAPLDDGGIYTSWRGRSGRCA